MQPSGARDRVRGAANIAGDERRASGVTGPSAEPTHNAPPPQPIAALPSPPIRRLHLSGVLRSHESGQEALWSLVLLFTAFPPYLWD